MIARYGLTVQEVADTVAAALGGRESGLLYEGDRRFDITVRVPDATRVNLDDIRVIPVLLPQEGGLRRQIPLAQVAQIRLTEGLNQISRENGQTSEERRVGKECVRTCRSGWSQSH